MSFGKKGKKRCRELTARNGSIKKGGRGRTQTTDNHSRCVQDIGGNGKVFQNEEAFCAYKERTENIVMDLPYQHGVANERGGGFDRK